MDIQRQVEQLRGRFQQLAEAGETGIPGSDELAAGLAKIGTSLEAEEVDDDERLRILVQGLLSLADVLEAGSPEDHGEPEMVDGADAGVADGSESSESSDGDVDDRSGDDQKGVDEGLDQFIDTFRKDAGKRIQGLSISLMGVFGDDDNDEALGQSIDHLHAIRGAAAMIGLDDVADLAGEMENLLSTRSKVEAPGWEWPTDALLRGYALLEEAIETDPPRLGEGGIEVIAELENADAGLRAIAPDMPEADKPTETDAGDDAQDDEPDDDLDDPPTDEVPVGDPDEGSGDETSLEQPILVVDDVETIAASVGFVLSELEVPVEVASDGNEAIQMLNEKSFSMVISDIDMPGVDGLDLTEMIRASDKFSDLPVILLTSLDDPEQRQEGLQAGATDYIIKGAIGGGELLRRVRELLQEAPVVERQKPTRKRRILVAEDTETVAASIAFVLSEGPFEIVLATDGKDALRRLDKEDVDLLITDLQMPFMTGTELVEEVRDHDDHDDLPVIMLTSIDDEQKRQTAIDAGVDRYIIKGEIAGGRLLSEVEQLLED